ncbi:MAG: hypothetical protein K8S14_11170 [Actinomycetia bacterium]|nr:hypothetical protein [Actinomycetes bacterium]
MLEIILIVLLGIGAASVFIWIMIKQFKGNSDCAGCSLSSSCKKENIDKNKCK